jgi:hypothetical protein
MVPTTIATDDPPLPPLSPATGVPTGVNEHARSATCRATLCSGESAWDDTMANACRLILLGGSGARVCWVGNAVGGTVGGLEVGETVGGTVGDLVVGKAVGGTVGDLVVGEAVGGAVDGVMVGKAVSGAVDGATVGPAVGRSVGALVVGGTVGDAVGATVGDSVVGTEHTLSDVCVGASSSEAEQILRRSHDPNAVADAFDERNSTV